MAVGTKVNLTTKLSPDYIMDKFYNILSTGGHIERSAKKNIGEIINKNYDKRFAFYDIIEKLYNKINHIEENE